jgi:hypothetical protein
MSQIIKHRKIPLQKNPLSKKNREEPTSLGLLKL